MEKTEKDAREYFQEGDMVRCINTPSDFVIFGEALEIYVVDGEGRPSSIVASDLVKEINYIIYREDVGWAHVQCKVRPEDKPDLRVDDVTVKRSSESLHIEMTQKTISSFIQNHASELGIFDIANIMNASSMTDVMIYLLRRKNPEPVLSLQEILNKSETKEEAEPYTNLHMPKKSFMKFKNFKWTQKDKIGLEEYISELEDNGWQALGSTQVPNKKKTTVIIHCIYNAN